MFFRHILREMFFPHILFFLLPSHLPIFPLSLFCAFPMARPEATQF
jgi:hypothetical protein